MLLLYSPISHLRHAQAVLVRASLLQSSFCSRPIDVRRCNRHHGRSMNGVQDGVSVAETIRTMSGYKRKAGNKRLRDTGWCQKRSKRLPNATRIHDGHSGWLGGVTTRPETNYGRNELRGHRSWRAGLNKVRVSTQVALSTQTLSVQGAR